MGGRRHIARYSNVKEAGTLVALSKGDGSSRSQVQMTQRGSSSGMDPSDLYACFLWKVENPPQFYVYEINSPVFNVCGTEWVIATCKDPDIENCMSLFLCVANHDKILPGWGQYAQFTVSAISEEPTNSIHCDGFHRFSKSELDWGWKDFMLSKDLSDGLIIDNTMEFRIQIQLMREKPHPLYSCIERKYRRELLRESGWEIEQTCYEFIKELKTTITCLARNKMEFANFGSFYKSLEKGARQNLSQERTDTICTALVDIFMKGEDTINTAVLIEMLYLGMVALAYNGNHNCQSIFSDFNDDSTSSVSVKNGVFVLADDIFKVINSFMRDDRPWSYEMILGLKPRSTIDDLSEEYTCEEELIFAEVGRRTLEAFAIVHIFCEKMYPEYLLHVSLKKQEELLQELDAERERQPKQQQKNKKPKNKKKKRKDKAMNSKHEASKQQDGTEANVGEHIPEKLIHEKLEHSSQLGGVATDFNREDNGAMEDKNLSHFLEETLASNTTNLELHLDNLSIDQSDIPWTRKEKKKSRATRTNIKQSRNSHQTGDSASKERKDFSIKKEPGGNPGNHKGIFTESPSTEAHKDEKIRRFEAAGAQPTCSQPSRVVDLSQKSWADFRLGLAFGYPSIPYIPPSEPSADYPYMNMINYIMEGEYP